MNIIRGVNNMCKKVESPKAEIASVLGALSVQVLSNLAAGSESTLGKVKEYYSVHHNHLPTGVEFFDGLCSGGLYDGISILAGVPNCGKTTLLVQVALSLSAKGIPVVFVSKDMKPEEVLLKAISYVASLGSVESVSVNDITDKYAAGSDLDDGVLNSFKNMASNLHIIDYNTHPFMSITDTNIQEESILGRLIEGYSKLFVQNPVFIIDSLQSIAVDYNRTSKEGVDLALANLKHYERKYHARMIVVSNLSRMYYDKDLDISCLKESGNIEYEASCILGMEIAGSAINLNDFRQELVRQIKIKNLKDRSGGYKEVVVEFDVLRSSFSTIQKNTSTPPKEGKSRKVSKDKKASDKVAKDNADFMDLFNKPLSDKELEALEMLNNGIKSGS